MASCDIIPIAAKACSGKCRGGGCSTKPSVWVLATCEGMAALFQKQPDGHLLPLMEQDSHVSSFSGGLRDHLILASENAAYSQLVLVGSAKDLAWTQASLPPEVSKHIVAEIEYPLMSSWFAAPTDITRLTQALENVF